MPIINTILYVEDEIDIQIIAKIALSDIGGFSLEICSSGNEAIEKAKEFTPDLILLDVMMPKLDGPQTLLELRKINNTKDTPIIFMTAKVQANEIEYYKSLGAIDVISKPFDPVSLAQKIKDIMA